MEGGGLKEGRLGVSPPTLTSPRGRPPASKQRKRPLCAPRIRTTPGFTAWISSRPGWGHREKDRKSVV